MNRKEAMFKFANYLKTKNIPFVEDVDAGAMRYTMSYKNYDFAPEGIIESCIWWFKDVAEIRIYFSERAAEICKSYPENHANLYRLFNYINANVWTSGYDGWNNLLYKSSLLYTPRIYMTEDGCCDITMTMMLPYDFYEVAPLETEDFITAALPTLMNDLSYSIFLVVSGKYSVDQAIERLKIDMLGENK